MARRRGRPSKAAFQQILEQCKSTIVTRLKNQPLRQPVDPAFDPYYQRILNGDLAAVLDYCDDIYDFQREPQHSFFELIGRLVPLQSIDAARQIIDTIKRCGDSLGAPPTKFVYEYWYETLRRRCEIARAFIREERDADFSLTPEKLWNLYVDHFYVCRREDKKGTARSNEIRKWKEWAKTGDSQGREHLSVNDQVDRFSVHFLVPKPIFLELAESSRGSYSVARRDKRGNNWKYDWTPSFIASKYASKMVGISRSKATHRQ